MATTVETTPLTQNPCGGAASVMAIVGQYCFQQTEIVVCVELLCRARHTCPDAGDCKRLRFTQGIGVIGLFS